MASSIQSRFMQLIFESEISEALELLQSFLDKQGGFDQVVDCITAWQDLIDSSDSALRPLLECLDDEDPAVIRGALGVVSALLRNAPDKGRAFRMKNELTELRFVNKLEQLSVGADPEVLDEIEQCQKLLRNEKEDAPSEKVLVHCTDATIMTSPEPLQPLLSTLHSMLLDDELCELHKLLLEKFIDTLPEIKTEADAEAVLQALRIGESPKQNGIDCNPAKRTPHHVSSKILPIPPPPAPPPLPQTKTHGFQDIDGRGRAPPPPPPPLYMMKGSASPSPPDPGPPSAPPPPVPALVLAPKQNVADLPKSMKPKRSPSKDLKMKPIMWSKISPSSIVQGQGSESVWGELAKESTSLCLDFDMIDGMFSIASSHEAASQNQPSFTNAKKKCVLVDLLNPKRSQNVTIVLKQFKDLDSIISDLNANKIGRFDVEQLRTLKTILPGFEEVDALRRYTGEIAKLTPACSFFLRLIDIPDYRLRIDCLLLRLEFHRIMEDVVPSLHLLKIACTELRESTSLRRLFLLLVNIGNYLNSSSSHGNAAGFKMSSLWKIIDHKAAKGSSSLLHLVAKLDPALLSGLEDELHDINKASEISVEEIKTSLKSLGEQCASLGKQLKSSAGSEFVEVREYLTDHCQIELEEANKSLEEFLEVQNNLAVFFCENQSSFKIEECLKIFRILIVRLRQALQENEEQEERRHRLKAAAQHNDKESAISKTEEQQENVFFNTLEKGQNLYRRRVKNEVASDREVVRTPRVKRLKENNVNNADKHESDGQRGLVAQNGQEQRENLNKISHETTMRPVDALDLNDYVEILEKNSTSHLIKKPEGTKPLAGAGTTTSFPDMDQKESDQDARIAASAQTAESLPKRPSEEQVPKEKNENAKVLPPAAPQRRPAGTVQPSRVPAPVSSKTSAPTRLTTSARAPQGKTTSTPPAKAVDGTKASATQKSGSTGISSTRIHPQHSAQPRVTPQKSLTTPVKRTTTTTVRKPATAAPSVQAPRTLPNSRTTPPSHVPSMNKTNSTAGLTKRPSNQVKITVATSRTAVPVSSPSPAHRSSLPTGSNDQQPQHGRRLTNLPQKRKDVQQEKRDVPVKPQVSTSSRPSLIKTGSVPQQQSLPKMDATEIPRPLRRTAGHRTQEATLSAKAKPKWM
ncbi:hypothetical protein Y032_0035g3097 [Ancylostoma ceylanicum]|nr:hypothetical protein Y032_0035g3097 [Ancylostoma ceylanicum]